MYYTGYASTVLFNIRLVIPLKYMLWVPLKSLLMELYYFTAFAKKTSRIGWEGKGNEVTKVQYSTVQ